MFITIMVSSRKRNSATLSYPSRSRWHQRGALRALSTPFLYMVRVGFERQLPIGDLQLTRSGFFAAKSWPPL